MGCGLLFALRWAVRRLLRGLPCLGMCVSVRFIGLLCGFVVDELFGHGVGVAV